MVAFQMDLKQQSRSDETVCSLWELCRVTESRHIGCVVLTGNRRVALIGPLANRVLERGGLRIRRDHGLETERPDQEPALQRAIDEAGSEGRTRMPLVALERAGCVSPLFVAVSTVRLHRTRTPAEPYECERIPLPAASNPMHTRTNGESLPHLGEGYALWLRDPLWFESNSIEELMDVFGLTRRESELALHLASGGDLAQFAATHHLSMNTVKSHLKQAFLKIGVKTQAQLIGNVHCLLH